MNLTIFEKGDKLVLKNINCNDFVFWNDNTCFHYDATTENDNNSNVDQLERYFNVIINDDNDNYTSVSIPKT